MTHTIRHVTQSIVIWRGSTYLLWAGALAMLLVDVVLVESGAWRLPAALCAIASILFCLYRSETIIERMVHQTQRELDRQR